MRDKQDFNLEEKLYCPIEGKPLPQTDKPTQYLLRFYSVLPIRILKIIICKRLKLPRGVDFQPGFRCTSGNLSFKGTAFLGDTLFIDYGTVHIGNNVGFSFGNTVITSTHAKHNFSRIITKPVVIEDDVWITTNVTILSGVRIGKKTIIGAGSVVTKDIPANCFAAGNPCKKIHDLNIL